MIERAPHLAVVIGAAPVAEELRRSLVMHAVPHAGVANHLRGLRRALALGEYGLVVLCVSADHVTLARHGRGLRTLLADGAGFLTAVRSVGLVTEMGFTSDVASLGCDVYVASSREAAGATRVLAERNCLEPGRFAALPEWITEECEGDELRRADFDAAHHGLTDPSRFSRDAFRSWRTDRALRWRWNRRHDGGSGEGGGFS